MKLGAFLVFLCCWLNPLFCAVDVYVFNVGQGNFIWVSMDIMVNGRPSDRKKVLIVDCGMGGGKKWINEKSFGHELGRMDLFNRVCSYALWLTHLHADHFKLLLSKNFPGSGGTMLQNIEYIFAGVGEGLVGEGLRELDYWPTSSVPFSIKKAQTELDAVRREGPFSSLVIQRKNEFRTKIGECKKSTLGQICSHFKEKNQRKPGQCFPIKIWDYYDPAERGRLQGVLDAFTADTGCHLYPLLPEQPLSLEQGYNDGKEPTNPNGQSLVLALDYGGRRVIFPGDAPGDLFSALSRGDQMYVAEADVLIAPHHGSINNKENLWETYNVKKEFRPRYCTIVSSIPVAGDFIPNKEFMNSRPSQPAFVATAHPVLVYNPDEDRNMMWMTRQTKFSMDENICYYHYHIGDEGAQSLQYSTKSHPEEESIEIVPKREAADLEGWESDWGG